MQPSEYYPAVRELVLKRVQAAIDSGKQVAHGYYFYDSPENLPADAPEDIESVVAVCAIGAFAFNGMSNEEAEAHIEDANGCEPDAIHAITAPLLMGVGVPSEDVGYILDALEAGFEGSMYAGFEERFEPMYHTPECAANFKKFLPFMELGREIGKRFADESDCREERARKLIEFVASAPDPQPEGDE